MSDEYREVDLNAARAHVIDALARLDALHGRRFPSSDTRGRGSQLAEVGKELLFVDHLLSKAKVLVLDEYHASRGFTGPAHVTETRAYEVTVTPTEEATSSEHRQPH